jgi:hypothetical protein
VYAGLKRDRAVAQLAQYEVSNGTPYKHALQTRRSRAQLSIDVISLGEEDLTASEVRDGLEAQEPIVMSV